MAQTTIHGGKLGTVTLLGDPATGRVKQATVRDVNGHLIACGDPMFAPAWAQAQIEQRTAMLFPGSMFWHSGSQQ